MTSLIQVESKSKPGTFHGVDVDSVHCTCRGFQFRGRCRHLDAVMPKREVAPAKPKRKLPEWREEIDLW